MSAKETKSGETPAPSEALWTVKDVAAFLKVSTRFVHQLKDSDRLPCVRLGAAVRFVPADVRAYIERLSRAPATVTPLIGRETIKHEED